MSGSPKSPSKAALGGRGGSFGSDGSSTGSGASSTVGQGAFMWKQGGMLKLWKRRWIVVNRDIIAYQEDEDAYPPKGVIQFSSLMQVVAGRRKCLDKSRKWPNTQPSWPQLSKDNYPMALVTPTRTFFLFFQTPKDGKRILKSISDQWAALAEKTDGLNPVTIVADAPEEAPRSRRPTSAVEEQSVQQLLGLCTAQGSAAPSAGQTEEVEEVEDAIGASFASCFRSDLLQDVTTSMCMREDAVADFVKEYQGWEREHGYPPTCRVLFHASDDTEQLLDFGFKTSAWSGQPSPLGDALYFFPDGKLASHYTAADDKGRQTVAAALVMLGQTGVRESLYVDDQVTRKEPVLIQGVDLTHPQNTAPPVGCLSAADPKLKQVAVYNANRCVPICLISYRLRLPLPNPFVEDAKDGNYLRSLPLVPRVWPEIEQSILIDEQARLPNGNLPLTRKAFRIYKSQMQSIRRRNTMSRSSVKELHERFCELQQDLAKRVEDLVAASKHGASTSSDKSPEERLETINAALRACLDSFPLQSDDPLSPIAESAA